MEHMKLSRLTAATAPTWLTAEKHKMCLAAALPDLLLHNCSLPYCNQDNQSLRVTCSPVQANLSCLASNLELYLPFSGHAACLSQRAASGSELVCALGRFCAQYSFNPDPEVAVLDKRRHCARCRLATKHSNATRTSSPAWRLEKVQLLSQRTNLFTLCWSPVSWTPTQAFASLSRRYVFLVLWSLHLNQFAPKAASTANLHREPYMVPLPFDCSLFVRQIRR